MERSWVLTDAAAGLWVETLDLGPEQLGIPGCAVRKRRLRGGLRDGVDLIEVTSGELSFSVVPTRGMGVWRARYGEHALGWRSPVRGPVHPAFVNPSERGGIGWLRGFDEWIVRCGLDSNGPPGLDTVPDTHGNPATAELPLHGMIANLPAHFVQVTADAAARVITVTGHVDEAGFFLPSLRLSTSISAGPDSSRITIADTVSNLEDRPAELQILYHCNYGPPFLEAGSRVLLPFTEAAPRDARAAEGVAEIDRYQGPTAGLRRAGVLVPAGRPAGRYGHSRRAGQRLAHRRSGDALRPRRAALLQPVEEHRRRTRRLRHRPGAGHQLPQLQERRARRPAAWWSSRQAGSTPPP